jgi:hypothetical protein
MAVPFGHLAGESRSDALRLDFDRRIKLHFHGAKLSSDGGLLLFRELDARPTSQAAAMCQGDHGGRNHERNGCERCHRHGGSPSQGG